MKILESRSSRILKENSQVVAFNQTGNREINVKSLSKQINIRIPDKRRAIFVLFLESE